MAQSDSTKRRTRRHHSLTKSRVDGFTGTDAGRYHDATVHTLALNVGKSGSKSWYLRYKARDGKQQSYRIGSYRQYNVTEARTEARKLLGKIAGGADPAAEKRAAIAHDKDSGDRVLSTFLDGYYYGHFLKHRRTGDATAQRIKASFAPFVSQDMDTITPEQLIRHRAKRLNAGIKPQTLNRERVSIHAMFEQAIKKGLVTANPASTDKFQPLEVIDDKRVRYLGMHDEQEGNPAGSERARFMAALETMADPFKSIVKLTMLTGCRRKEILHLKWADVSLRDNRMTVTAYSAKSAKARHLALVPQAVDTFKSLRPDNVIALDREALVFPNPMTGKPFGQVNKQWRTLCRKAEVVDFKFHDMRHDVASRLVMAGVTLYEVADILGHSDTKMTERYAHLSPDTLKTAMDKLNAGLV